MGKKRVLQSCSPEKRVLESSIVEKACPAEQQPGKSVSWRAATWKKRVLQSSNLEKACPGKQHHGKIVSWKQHHGKIVSWKQHPHTCSILKKANAQASSDVDCLATRGREMSANSFKRKRMPDTPMT